ncbi:endoglucanase 14-like [Aristolochia californica]|uniref:endoglucanase 14-like n=1 Tax=Aristolochia californica TaxID=171875 RepID=UPI0035DD8381
MASGLVFLLLFVLLHQGYAASNYGLALTQSLLYFEAQRSGKLPHNQRAKWRGDSGLQDGRVSGVDLVGGYYDAGDNVKFGFPMAFSITLLSWGVVEFGARFSAKHELSNALAAIKWGTDYFIKAHPSPEVLYGEVGDGQSDHACWMRPEDMTTSRAAYKIDAAHPGSDLAGETAAAMAAASIAFRRTNASYANTLLGHSKQLFDFAHNHRGLYSDSIPDCKTFYKGSGYEDELSWAAAWLHHATGDKFYLDFLSSPGSSGGQQSEFSWDDKYAGVQTLVARLVLDGKVPNSGVWAEYKNNIEQFICSCIQKGNTNIKRTPAGLLWWYDQSSLQYVTSSMLLTTIYSDYLANASANLQCPRGTVQPSELISFARSQVDYILGANPLRLSYTVGYGRNYPKQVHHRGASIVSIKKDPTPVGCGEGYERWFSSKSPNPNILLGAMVAGPNSNDGYNDTRANNQQTEPATTGNAALIGVLARVA